MRMTSEDLLLDGEEITGTGASAAFDKGCMKEAALWVKATKSAGSSLTVYLDGSPDGSSWFKIDEVVLSASGEGHVTTEEFPRFVRGSWKAAGATPSWDVELWLVCKG
jgi:hypothetical protein